MSAGSSSNSYVQEGVGTLWDSSDPFSAENYTRAKNFYGIKSPKLKEWYGKTQMFQMDSSMYETPEQSQLAQSLERAQGRQSTDSNMYGLQSLAQPSGPTLGGQ